MAIKRGVYNIEIFRGDTFNQVFQHWDVNKDTGVRKVVDLSNWTLNAQLRNSPNAQTVEHEFVVKMINAKEGIFSLNMTAEQTANLNPPILNANKGGTWDLQYTHKTSKEVGTLITGSWTVINDTTREDV
ncbi:hypothetical protein [Aeromonas hydrophila]|uniref:hypothetical protein n=1 Tax=Aeromonas hydrophila TaxID=644 RepID=UPI003D21D681